MPLHILITLVVFGIAGVALLTHLLGLSRSRRFHTADEAAAAWSREFSQIEPVKVTLCKSGAAALIETAQGPGIVWAMGADSTARLLDGAQADPSETGLFITLPDYSAPHISVRLTPEETSYWTQTIGASA